MYYFTKWSEAYAIPNQGTSIVAKAFGRKHVYNIRDTAGASNKVR